MTESRRTDGRFGTLLGAGRGSGRPPEEPVGAPEFEAVTAQNCRYRFRLIRQFDRYRPDEHDIHYDTMPVVRFFPLDVGPGHFAKDWPYDLALVAFDSGGVGLGDWPPIDPDCARAVAGQLRELAR